MRDEAKVVRDAFASLEPPADLNERTLRLIEAYASENDGEFAPEMPSRMDERQGGKAQRSKNRHAKGKPVKFFALAACFAFAFVGVFSAKAYAEPTAYIDVDADPSITLAVNRFDRVVSAEGLNSEGAELLEEVNVKGLKSSEAMDKLLASDAMSGYLDDDSLIEVRVACDGEKQTKKLEKHVDESLSESKRSGSCSSATMEEREAAHEKGMGVGRYEMAKKLMESDPQYDFDDCASMSMRELREHAGEGEGEEQSENGQGNGLRHGTGSKEAGKGFGNGQGAGSGSGNCQDTGGHGKGKAAD